MTPSLHNPPDGMRQVLHWYKKAQIDYSEQFLSLYIAYNAWYREVTGTSQDREAIGMLKKRFIIWDDYASGKTMVGLRAYMDRLAEFTQREPLTSTASYWNGEIQSADDWRSLIEYWYRVRCLIVHGAKIKPQYAWLAFETLDIFLGEIVDRVQACLESDEYQETREMALMASDGMQKSEQFKQLQMKLYQKYVALPDIWQVDMRRT